MENFLEYDILNFDQNNENIVSDVYSSVYSKDVNLAFNIPKIDNLSLRILGKPVLYKTMYIDLNFKEGFYNKIKPFILRKLLNGNSELYLKIIDKYDSIYYGYNAGFHEQIEYGQFKEFFDKNSHKTENIYFNVFSLHDSKIYLFKYFLNNFLSIFPSEDVFFDFSGLNGKDVILKVDKTQYKQNLSPQNKYLFRKLELSKEPSYLLSQEQFKKIKNFGLWKIDNVLEYFNDKTLKTGKGFISYKLQEYAEKCTEEIIKDYDEHFLKENYSKKILENIDTEHFRFSTPIENIEIN